ncbi:DUF3040 domain-containing protein [Cellulomonas sp. NPDC057328]|uniref:DUF3040 domain-containing protein n=1 Tax=Cellulomonas sp. NPDC057328 TaxID=3346101 RepID=UPI0036268F4A
MPLSEYEQRVLEQMERQLTSDDPRLANTLTSRGGRRPVTRYVIAGAGAVVGLLLLVVGAASSEPWLGALGFVVMFAAVAFAFAAPRRARSGPQGAVRPDGTVRRPTGATRPGTRKQGFMSRMEERWDRRRHEGDR